MPPPKKAAKKSPGHPDPKKPVKDARRAYEHVGRVQSMIRLVSEDNQALLQTLMNASEEALSSGFPKDAADLARTGEHFAFASLRGDEEPDASLSKELREALTEEFEHLLGRADEHGAAADAPKQIARVYNQLRANARRSFKKKRFRAAMEFARGAEALTHLTDIHEALRVGGGQQRELGA